MGNWTEDIRNAVTTIVKPLLKPFVRQTLLCSVVGSVDTSTYTIKVKPVSDDGPEFNARLLGSQRNSYDVLITPANGSTVWVTRPPMAIGAAFITKVDKYEAVNMQIGPFKLDLKASNGVLIFNDGNNKGIPMSPQLQTRLNLLENDINNLKTLFSTWGVVPSDGGAALKAITAPWYSAQLASTQLNDIQNPDIQQ
jgi:hypothetical protein